MAFKRTITVQPAYDCIRVQPCIHGSTDCGTRPGASHGVHGCEMHMSLATDEHEVTLVLYTGWDLPQTPHNCRHTTDRMGAFVEYHSTAPVYEGQEPAWASPKDCPRNWSACYVSTVYSLADEGGLNLVTGGTDAAWAWIEGLWNEQFGGAQ